MSDKITIYSMAACPYAQRARIVLTFKEIAHEVVTIDLTKPRPDWFLALNPKGKVPVVDHKGDVLAESSIISEYLEEVYGDKPVLPKSPLHRAQVRLLVQFANERFAPHMYRALMEQEPARRERAEATAAADWLELEEMLKRSAAALGSIELSLAEISLAPFFARYELCAYYWGFAPWKRAGLDAVHAFQEKCASHPAIVATGLPGEELIKLYEDYAYGYSNGKVRPGRLLSSFDLSVPLEVRPMPPRREEV